MADPENAGRYWRPAVFLCDEYHSFATTGGDDPGGDERAFALSRQSRCVPDRGHPVALLAALGDARHRRPGERCCRRCAPRCS